MSKDMTPRVISLHDWKARALSAKGDERTATPACSIGSAMRSSALYVLAGMGVLAGVFALPAAGEAVSWVWYGWARLITREYSDVTPALWIDWLSMIAAAWALAMAYKLGNSKFELSAKCAGLMVALLLFGAIPALCALYATAPGMHLADGNYPLMAKMALFTANASLLLIGLGVIAAGIAAIVIFPQSERE